MKHCHGRWRNHKLWLKFTSYDLSASLRNKSCKRLRSRRNKALLVFADFFTVNAHHTWTEQAFVWHCRLKQRFHSSQSNKWLIRISTTLPKHIITSHVGLSTVWKEACIRVVVLSCSHRYKQGRKVSHSQPHTNNRFFDLVQPLVRVYLILMLLSTQYKTKWLTAVGSHCLAASPAKMSEFKNNMWQNTTNVTWKKTLKIYCQVIVTQ